MEKKAYTQPAIVRVKLNHEQAVLSTCSVGGTSLQNQNLGGACKTDGTCRQSMATMGIDAGASS
jgi:hypothetical protein